MPVNTEYKRFPYDLTNHSMRKKHTDKGSGLHDLGQGTLEGKKRKDPYGKDTFLQLLVAQMRHQDPMEPLKNEQMLAQMAQFSAVEQITNLGKSFDKFVESFDKKFPTPKESKDEQASQLSKTENEGSKETDKIQSNSHQKIENESKSVEELLKIYNRNNEKLLEKIDVLLEEIRLLHKA